MAKDGANPLSNSIVNASSTRERRANQGRLSAELEGGSGGGSFGSGGALNNPYPRMDSTPEGPREAGCLHFCQRLIGVGRKTAGPKRCSHRLSISEGRGFHISRAIRPSHVGFTIQAERGGLGRGSVESGATVT